MKHQDRVKEFMNMAGERIMTQHNGKLQFIPAMEDWLLTQFNGIDKEWKKKIKGAKHTAHTHCCCNDMLNKLLK